jgi:type I restriction enzyme S subunit
VLAVNGDVIACEGGEPGRAAVWRGEPIAIQKALHRIRPASGISPEYLALSLRAQASTRELDRLFTGTTIKHLPQEKLRQVTVGLAPTAEQDRIVAAIEEAFSKLDAGETGLRTVRQLLKRMRDAVLAAAVTGRLVPQDPADTPATELLAEHGQLLDSFPALPHGWVWASVETVGTVDLGRQRHPDWHEGPNMRPYLRVANVFEDRIDTSDLKEMHFDPHVFERFRLREGDVLLNEGQTPELLGRPAIYRGDPPEVAFTNSILRYRPGSDATSEWALLVFRHYMRSGRFTREARITTNIAHLSASRLRPIEFPVPPLEEQVRIVTEVERRLSVIEACERALDECLGWSGALRRSVLKAAFEGHLVAQDPTDEPASVLLERIRVERAAAPTPKRRRARSKS